MTTNKKEAYDKLFKYVGIMYPESSIKWFVGEEMEDKYSMKAMLPIGRVREISINYESLIIIDKEPISVSSN